MGTMYFRNVEELPDEFSELPDSVTDTAEKILEECGVETYTDWEIIGVQSDGAEVLLRATYDSSKETIDLSNRTVTDHGDPSNEYDHHYVVNHYSWMAGNGRVERVSGDTVTLAVTGRY